MYFYLSKIYNHVKAKYELEVMIWKPLPHVKQFSVCLLAEILCRTWTVYLSMKWSTHTNSFFKNRACFFMCFPKLEGSNFLTVALKNKTPVLGSLGCKSILHFIGEVLFWFFSKTPKCVNFIHELVPAVISGGKCSWGTQGTVYNTRYHKFQDSEWACYIEPASFHTT